MRLVDVDSSADDGVLCSAVDEFLFSWPGRAKMLAITAFLLITAYLKFLFNDIDPESSPFLIVVFDELAVVVAIGVV